MIVEINRLLKGLIPDHGLETFSWIRQKIYFNDKAFLTRKSYINGKLTRKVRKHKYQFKIAQDLDSIKQFYDELYTPYMNYRFGDITHLRSFREIRITVKNGFMLKIFDQNLWVAGVICGLKGSEIVSFAIGLLPDYKYHLRRGVLLTAYHFLIKWAQDHDMEAVDLLRSRPHIKNGVYEHKRLWGAKRLETAGCIPVSIYSFPVLPAYPIRLKSG